MAKLYKRFISSRTVFYAVLACFFMASGPALAQTELFTVEGVRVDVTAENALAARDQAFDQAQQKAFKVLAERMLSEEGAKVAEAPPTSTISTMIQDYEVTQEKLSSVRYIGTYTFRFRDSAVRQYFKVQNVQYSDVSSKPLLVLPFFQYGGKMILWSPYNSWMQAWGRAASPDGLVPLLVPMGDLDDVNDIGDDEALHYNRSALANLVGRYGAGEAVMVVATPDDNLSLVTHDDKPATGALTIHIYRTDRDGPEFVQQAVVTASSNQTRGQLLDQAVKTVQGIFQKDWKARTLAAPVAGNKLQVRVGFNNLQEWATTRKALSRVPGVEAINIKSLTPRGALIELAYQGTEERLRLALEQADMNLSQPRVTGYANGYGMEPTVYELTVNKAGSYRPGSYTPGYTKRF